MESVPLEHHRLEVKKGQGHWESQGRVTRRRGLRSEKIPLAKEIKDHVSYPVTSELG